MLRWAGILACVGRAVWADPAEVVGVEAVEVDGTWRFAVTLRHPDTGWDHYADGWDIVDAEGEVLGERPLAHPHVEEQPFTRSTSGVVIPDGTVEVFIRTRCNVDGWRSEWFAVRLDN